MTIQGLRVGDATVLQRLCAGDSRLFLRVGALLQARLAFSEPALGALVETAAGKTLVNDRTLKDCTADGFAALLTTHQVSELGLVLVDDQTGAETGWRVIVLEDEIGNPLLAEPEPQPITAVAEVIGTLTPSLRGPVEGFLAARADDQRAAALEQLRYAMPPLPVVGNLMPLLLVDGAELVRERAIGLLVGAGAHVAVVDLVRALQRRDDATLLRLGDALAGLSADQQDVACSALLANCVRGQASQALVAICVRLAEHLATFRDLSRLIELLVSTRLSLLDLARALQRFDAERIDGILRRQFGQGVTSDATLVVLLARPGIRDDELLRRGLDLLLEARPEPVERMALAAALRRLDGGMLIGGLLVERLHQIVAASDTSVHWLLAERCRDGAIDLATGTTLATAVRGWLREASGPHLVALLEQQIPALLPASDAVRSTLVEPLVEVIARFRDERSADLVENCLAGLGDAAIGPLWQLVEEHPHQPVRLLAIGLVPPLVERQSGGEPRTTGAKRLLACLVRATQAEERGALVAAAARLAAAPESSTEIADAVDIATRSLGAWGVEALGFLAAGPHCSPERRQGIVAGLIDRLCEDLPDHNAEAVRDPATDELTWQLDDHLAAHTEDVPRLLNALSRIGRSPYVPTELLTALVGRLCNQWRKVAGWQVIWGPANIQELGALLGSLAEQPTFPPALRVRVCEALLPRIKQLAIARSLVKALIIADGAYASDLAGRATAQLIKQVADGWYSSDEHPELMEVLVEFLAIPQLGKDDEVMRRRLAALIASHRSDLSSRSKDRLRGLLPKLPEGVRSKLDWA